MSEAVVFIPLTQGKVATIDFDDFETVRGYRWYANKIGRGFYAVTNIQKRGCRDSLLMHRLLLPDSEQVDHINGDGLDNRRKNLRAATHAQNHQAFQRKGRGATSGFRGVYRRQDCQRWAAQIKSKGKTIYLGLFENEQDAALAYDIAARKLFGKFASPNFHFHI